MMDTTEVRTAVLQILSTYWPEAGGQTAHRRAQIEQSTTADAIMVVMAPLMQENEGLRRDFGTIRARLLALVDFAEERRDG